MTRILPSSAWSPTLAVDEAWMIIGEKKLELQTEKARLEREKAGKTALAIVESYLGAMKRQASSARIVAQIVGDESSIAITRFTRKGMAEAVVPAELHQALIDHRSHFLNERGYPWFRFEASVTGSVRIITSFTQEPTFEYTDEALMLDLIEFPRHLSETPEWFQKRMVDA